MPRRLTTVARALRAAAAGVLALGLLAPVRAAAAVSVDARLSAASVDAGSVVTLLVTVSEPKGSVTDPQFDLPGGLELLGSSRSQQMSWVNGRSSNQITFRFEIGTQNPGRYSIGPIRVSVGGQSYRSGELALSVTPAGTAQAPARGGRGRASDAASLVLSLDPPQPVVGQACRLKVQLVQRVEMAEDAEYAPPATPGFWSERWGEATSYQAREGRRSVVVTERSLRLYPLAPGPAVVTPAHALVTPRGGGLLDPFGGLSSSRIEIASESLRVRVRPLPAGAPAGFDAAVGEYDLAWSADRSHTSQDQAITVRLDLRGVGNLPLLRAPAYQPNDFEVFAATVDDSLPTDGSIGRGRRAFVWTLLPKRAGHLRVTAPTFVWFDPAASRYVTATPAALALDVISAKGTPGGEDADGLPGVFRTRRATPGSRAAWPPLALAGGLLVTFAILTWRKSLLPDAGAPERARQREWLRSIGLSRGPDFWRAADEAAHWLQQRGHPVQALQEAIAAARYGGRTNREDEVRRRLVEQLGAAMPSPPPRWPMQAGAVVAVLAGLALLFLAWPRGGEAALEERAASADTRARAGRAAQAEAEWARLWDERPGDPGLAARLAWGALVRDDVGAATVWVLRGDRGEARDPALAVLAARVRDAGGLVGAPGRSLPLRSSEWMVLAFVLAVAAGVWWSRRRTRTVLLLLAIVCGLWWTAETEWRARQPLAVVRTATPLGAGGVTLEAGQVVRVIKRTRESALVRATADLEGELAPGTLWFLERRR